jgi:hypothetical protein
MILGDRTTSVMARARAGIKCSLYEGQDIGEDSGSPVDFTYKPPFAFNGQLHKVTVELK